MTKENILITGGAGGIGVVCAETLSDYKLIITDYKQDIVDKTVADLKAKGIDAVGLACDISNQESIDQLVAFTKDQGKLKGIVHTAGVSGTVNNTKLVYDINLLASYRLIQSFKSVLDKGGAMVLFSSMMGHSVPANEAYDEALRNPHLADSFDTVAKYVDDNADTMYNFTKRGILLMLKDFAMEFGKLGARIVSVSPGVILTPMAKKALEEHPETMKQTLDMTPLARYGIPEDIAKAVKFLLSDNASFITGTDLLIDGGVMTQVLK